MNVLGDGPKLVELSLQEEKSHDTVSFTNWTLGV